jgi:hypothetical protein
VRCEFVTKRRERRWKPQVFAATLCSLQHSSSFPQLLVSGENMPVLYTHPFSCPPRSLAPDGGTLDITAFTDYLEHYHRLGGDEYPPSKAEIAAMLLSGAQNLRALKNRLVELEQASVERAGTAQGGGRESGIRERLRQKLKKSTS